MDRSAARAVVDEVVVRLQADLDAPWTLGLMAEMAGYEPAYFDRLYRRVVGRPPMRHLSALRLERAAFELEQDAEQSVAAVAARAGYQTRDGFSRAFRRAFGVSPTGFRRRLARATTPGTGQAPDTAPSGLVTTPEVAFDGVQHGFSRTVPYDAPADWGEAMAAATAWAEPASNPVGEPLEPRDAQLSVGAFVQPWGFSSGSHDVETHIVRRTRAPVRPPAGWRRWAADARRWARFDFDGDVAQLGSACFWVIERELPAAGLRQGYAPVVTWLADPSSPAGRARIDVPLR